MTLDGPTKTSESPGRAPLIVFALPSLCMGGAEVVCVSLATELLKRGYRVNFAFGSQEVEARLHLPEGARTRIFGLERTREFVLPFAKYLREERPDVVVALLWPFTAACILAHKLSNIRGDIVVWDHNTLSVQYAARGLGHRMFLAASIAATYPLAHARIAVSGGVADDLAQISGIARDRFSVIFNPMLDRPPSDEDKLRAQTIWGGWSGPRLITVGRFKGQKNYPLLIRAFKMLLARRDARLLMLGTGDLLENIRALARTEGVADQVIIPGELVNPTSYYESADLFVLSSDYEGLPTVLIEALASGLPVVSTDCKSGPREILVDERFGRLVPVGDADALARAMDEALSASHDGEALKRRAAEFTPDSVAEQYLRVIFPQSEPPREEAAGG